jgi:hypothetical protein
VVRLLLIPVILAVFAGVTPSAPVPKGADQPSVYSYPTTVGSKLGYEEQRKEVTYVVTRVEEREGGNAKLVTTERVAKDGNLPGKTVAVSTAGLAGVGVAGRDLDEPVWLLCLPAGSQQGWKDDYGDEVRVVGTEPVVVPAGAFETVRVDGTAHIGGRVGGRNLAPRYHSWYAPDIGLVKSVLVYGPAETRTLTVLKSFTPGKN